MNTGVSVSLILDKRSTKKDGTHPIKLYIYNSVLNKDKRYSTNFSFTEKEFESIYLTSKPRNEHKEVRIELQAVEHRAIEIAKGINPFTFEQFEKKLFRNVGEGENVYYQYQIAIDIFKKQGQIGTASTYELSLKSLKEYWLNLKGKEPKRLLFSDITVKWLNGYEVFMTDKGRSLTTVSMYLRALRAIFNKAIAEKEIDGEFYPFGKRKYQVPAKRSVKKALSKEQLKTLFEAETNSVAHQKAKDFWFFSYSCNGMNIKDIALLKYKDLQDDKLIYYRAKTMNTGKADLKPIIVYLTDYTKSIIEKYGNTNKNANNLVFSIISENQTIEDKQRSIKNFTRFINQHIKEIALSNGITGEISTYWARHSFATNAIRSGASMEFVSEALNHSNLKVTQGYFSGFEDKDKKEFMAGLMDFSK